MALPISSFYRAETLVITVTRIQRCSLASCKLDIFCIQRITFHRGKLFPVKTLANLSHWKSRITHEAIVMNSAGLRHRSSKKDTELIPPDHSLIPPRYTIDLSLPPAERYNHIARGFVNEVHSLPILFDQIILQTGAGQKILKWVKRMARLGLRGLYSRMETEELRGISRATGIEMYLLVAFNVLLDLFMGCTSGGVRVRDSERGVNSSRMLHFRALDWGMPELRRVVVILDFVRATDGPVIATSITYFGYVGALTGVRQGLSISLNFRPLHDATTWWKGFRFTFHQILVLLGWRQSISSLLRAVLLPEDERTEDIRTLVGQLKKKKSTAAYLILCTGQETYSLEKDYQEAVVQSSKDFIVTMNHDVANEQRSKISSEVSTEDAALIGTGMLPIVSYSVQRKKCAEKLWHIGKRPNSQGESYITMTEMMKWLQDEEINNTQTHYICLMDPTIGKVLWIERHIEAVTPFDQIMATIRKGR